MRILLITETVPYPLDSGGRIKTWHTLEALSQEHEVHCHAFVRDTAQRDAAVEPLRSVCCSVVLHLLPRGPVRELRHLARSVARGLPFTVARHFSEDVCETLIAACRARRIDTLYCDHLSMLEYGVRAGARIVHDAHNVEHRIVRRYAESLGLDARRPLFEREWRRLLAYEAATYPRTSLIFSVSATDREAIAALAGIRTPVVAVPIPVNASGVHPIARLTSDPEVLFLGTLDWPPNADAVEFFLREIWRRIRRRVPGARLTVVGRGEASLARRWRKEPGVRFTGRVPDIEPWIRRSRVMVVPLRAGSGMRVKILDAFARGLPVVSTSIGYEGIDARPGEHLLAADDPEAFAAATTQVLQDDVTGERLALKARELALERYDTAVVARQQLDAIREWLS